jgi:stage III sporulation protein AB
MMGKVLGAAFVIAACGSYGFSIASGYKKRIGELRQMIAALNIMECELQYRHTHLSELCRTASKEVDKPLRTVLNRLSTELDRQVIPDVSTCMQIVLKQTPDLTKEAASLLEKLGHFLGKYDLPGQIQELEGLRTVCSERLCILEENSTQKARSYKTLGLCAGIALAILMI